MSDPSLTERELRVLEATAQGVSRLPRHGAWTRESIDRLHSEGFISRAPRGRAKTFYEITDKGRAFLASLF